MSGDIFLFVGIAPVREYAFRGLPEAGAIKGVFYDQPLWLPVRSNILSLPWHIFYKPLKGILPKNFIVGQPHGNFSKNLRRRA